MKHQFIEAKKNLYNSGKCFTRGKTYKVIYSDQNPVKTEAGLMERRVYNDQGEEHMIGSWWREFEIVQD